MVAYSDSIRGPGSRKVAPGRGNEARAYLMALVDYYDKLPDAMVFIHGHHESWHTDAGPGKHVDGTWRLGYLTWPIIEYYVPLSVSCHALTCFLVGQQQAEFCTWGLHLPC